MLGYKQCNGTERCYFGKRKKKNKPKPKENLKLSQE